MECVSLYLHIPFCKRKCDYCDFFSVSSNNSGVPNPYLIALMNEISFYRSYYDIPFWKTVYIGGGTPSLLTSEQLEELLTVVLQGNPKQFVPEISVEMNPDDITADLLASAEHSGVNRISVGIQSLNDLVLTSVNRRCSRFSSLSALSLIDRLWHRRFSADMISGFADLSDEAFLSGLSELLTYSPDHVSLYALTIAPETPLGRRMGTTRTAAEIDASDSQWLLGRDYLEANGYRQYEVSNFAKPGFESCHNSTYWRLQSYVGCGAGASGTFYSDIHSSCGERWNNTEDIQEYIRFWSKKRSQSLSLPKIPRTMEKLEKKTEEFEFFMMGFRLSEGINSEEFYRRFGFPLQNIPVFKPGALFDEWVSKNLAKKYRKNGNLYFSLTREGMLFLNTFLEKLEI